MLTERKLIRLFDMADFSENDPLTDIIAETLNRHIAEELSDDDVADLAAAGNVGMTHEMYELDDPFGTLLIDVSQRRIIGEKRVPGNDL